MPRREKELLARDAKRNLGEELLQAIRDAKAGRRETKIDTEIRHVTKPGANVFLELGFSPKEVKRLRATSRK